MAGKKRKTRSRVVETPWMERTNVLTFLALLSQGHATQHSLEEAGLGRTVAYERRKVDPEFSAAWEEAYACGTEHYEEAARKRAIEGCTRPIMYKGEKVGEITEFSDDLLKFILSARAPHKYRTRHEHTGPGGTPLNPMTPNPVALVQLTIEGPPTPAKPKREDKPRE